MVETMIFALKRNLFGKRRFLWLYMDKKPSMHKLIFMLSIIILIFKGITVLLQYLTTIVRYSTWFFSLRQLFFFFPNAQACYCFVTVFSNSNALQWLNFFPIIFFYFSFIYISMSYFLFQLIRIVYLIWQVFFK